jgi:curved DNA-binding protein CbpA
MALANHYELLGIDPQSDFKAIKKAYFSKAKECHPDRFNNSRAKEEEFKRVVGAFDVLSDPDKRKNYDESLGIEIEENVGSASFKVRLDSIMDSPADDILEELIVGNNPPPDTTLATLLSDLEQTRIFVTFREGKTLFSQSRFKASLGMFQIAVATSPGNILYRCFLARACAALKDYRQAKLHYSAALSIGEKRTPPQNLFRVRRELENVEKKRLPWWHSCLSFLLPEKSSSFITPAHEEMIENTNRAIARICEERKKRGSKRKELKE